MSAQTDMESALREGAPWDIPGLGGTTTAQANTARGTDATRISNGKSTKAGA